MHPQELISFPQAEKATTVSLWYLIRYFFTLGTLGFGGPVPLVIVLQKI